MGLEWKCKESDPRVLVLLWDGEPWREVRKSVFFRPLKKMPMHLTKEEFFAHFAKWEESRAKSYAHWSLSKRPLLSKELVTQLHRVGFSAEIIAATIAHCKEKGFIDDDVEIERQVLKELRKGYGSKAILFKLSLKGIERALIQKHLNKGETDALEAAVKKYTRNKALDDPKEKQKVIAKLVRRGFSLEAVLSRICI